MRTKISVIFTDTPQGIGPDSVHGPGWKTGLLPDLEFLWLRP